MNIKKKTSLSPAEEQLSPRVERLRTLANSAAVGAELMGIVVHVDLDAVDENRYVKVRQRIAGELDKFPCPFALALAAWETEAWLMQFPRAFSKVNAGWTLKDRYRGCDLQKIHDPKRALREHSWRPPYEDADAPRIMEKAFEEGVLMEPEGRNRSYQDFIGELSSW
ncbi:hypothetical protein [Streptomyces uncialis]|uniref:hypothetical protein n=1 Tax=Streptomyces uncialis TaxID=1048205 RepID=UPI003869FB8B|nr:hypothetical protein OG924_27525 [Streptomyces uncialis]